MEISATDSAGLYDLGDSIEKKSKPVVVVNQAIPSDPILGQNFVKCDKCRFSAFTGTACPHHPSSNPGDCEFNAVNIREHTRKMRGSPNKNRPKK